MNAGPPVLPPVGEPLPASRRGVWDTREAGWLSLDKSHTDGGPKAKGFETILGIAIEDIDYLDRAAILLTPVSASYMRPPYGVHCEVRVPIGGLGDNGDRTVEAITGWEYAEPGDPLRMTTAYLKPR